MKNERLAVVLPVYNEVEAIGHVLDKWCDALEKLGIDFQLHPYNDGSRDGSLTVMRQASERHPGRIVVHDKANSGHGPTILKGYREASASGFDWIFQIDSDDEMGPERFSEMWSQRDGYDFLVGSRKGRQQALPRKVVSAISRLTVRVFYGKGRVRDVNSPYRLMRTAAFKYIYDWIPQDTFAPNVAITGLAMKKHLRCLELPVEQHDRTTGEVSIKKWKLLKAAFHSFLQTTFLGIDSGISDKLCILISIIIALSGIQLTSVLWEFFGIPCPNPDSNVFMTIGRMMCSGCVPYKDVFDHKGPILYLIEFFAFRIGNYKGVIVPEFFALFTTAFIALKIMLKLTRPTIAVMSLVIMQLFLLSYLDGGNYTEEYAMPAVAFGVYSLVLISLSISLRKLQCLLLGMSAAWVLLLKFNHTCVFIVVGLLYLYKLIFEKDIRWRIFMNIVITTLGFCLVVLPIIAWLYYNNALQPCINDYLRFNLAYANKNGSVGLIKMLMVILHRVCAFPELLVLPFATLILVGINKKSKTLFLVLLSLLFELPALLSGGFIYTHYFLTLLPTILVSYSIGLNFICKRRRIFIYGFICISLLAVFLTIEHVYEQLNKRNEISKKWEAMYDPIVKSKLSANNNLLLVTGCTKTCQYYRRFDAWPDGKFIFLPPLPLRGTMLREFTEFLESGKARIILIPDVGCFNLHKELKSILDKRYKATQINIGILYEPL